MKTSIFGLAGAVIAGSLSPGCANAAQPKQSNKTIQQPNILFIFVDDMGYYDLGYTGSDLYETPIIDDLASRSMRFTNAYASGGNSVPSRACLLTGQYSPRHEVFAVTTTKRGPEDQMRLEPYPNQTSLQPNACTFADAMRIAGYRTGMVGKWHLGSAAKNLPDRHGFDVSQPVAIPSMEEFAQTNDPKNFFVMLDKINAFMEETLAEGNSPFLAYLSFHLIHDPQQPGSENSAYFQTKLASGGPYRHNDYMLAGSIKHVDEAVGILMDKLKETGADKNTLVLFASDNGGLPKSTQEPLRGFKGQLYEGGLRVPMFVYYPGVVAPGDCDVPVVNVDFYPTFLDLAGAKKPAGKILDGESLLPLLKGEASKLEREAIFWHFPGYLENPSPGGRDNIFRQRPSTAMRKGDWKITLFYEEWLLDGGREKIGSNNSVELYNLKDDISESRNLVNAGENKAVRDELLDELLAWIESTGSKIPTVK